MAEVWLAHPVGDPSARVALKRALPHLAHEPLVDRSLRDEARWLERIAHPNVVGLRELREHDGQPVLVLDWVDGLTLGALLDAQARHGVTLSPPLVQRIGYEFLEGLGAVHAAGVVHGDVTPGNVLVGLDGVTRVIDLGLGAPVGTEPPAGWQGTAAYTSPERWERATRMPSAEVFAAGVVLWESLRGERLYGGGDLFAVRQRILDAEARRLDEGRPDLAPWADVLAAALDRDPARRTASIGALGARWFPVAPAASPGQVSAHLAAVSKLRRSALAG